LGSARFHERETVAFSARGQSVQVTVTIGLAEVSSDIPLDVSTSHADEALYEGKRGERNCVVAHGVEDRPSSSVEESTSSSKSHA